jgi:hypothetical protein
LEGGGPLGRVRWAADAWASGRPARCHPGNQASRHPGIQASRQRVSESASQPVSQSASWAEGARAASRVRKLGLRRQTDRVFQNSDSSRPTLALVLGWGDLSHQFIGWGAKVCGHQAGETASPCGLWRGGEGRGGEGRKQRHPNPACEARRVGIPMLSRDALCGTRPYLLRTSIFSDRRRRRRRRRRRPRPLPPPPPPLPSYLGWVFVAASAKI